MEVKGLKALRRKGSRPAKELETFPAPAGVMEVQFICNELTSICPVTGQPDFSSVEITYAPDKKCVESKSLKQYLWTFRNEGWFCESLSSAIASDIFNAANARWCKVVVRQNIRGGIAIVATSEVKRQ
jgi:7-cyano-7-deazaguanine reductase